MPDDDQDWERGPGRPRPLDPHAEWQQTRDLAVTVPCPHCRVPAGTACVNRGGPEPAVLKRFPAHPKRIKVAREVTR